MPYKIIRHACIVTLLLFCVVIPYLSVQDKSPTFDEPRHFFTGLRFAFGTPLPEPLWSSYSPPLETIYVLPALLTKQDFSNDIRMFLDHISKIRIMTLLYSLLMAFFVYRWSSELYDKNAGLFSLGLCAFCPNILAHAALVTTDMSLTCLAFVWIYYVWKTHNHFSYVNILFCGVFFGLALISKFTFMMFIPAYLCIGLFLFLISAPEKRPLLLKRFILVSFAAGLIGLIVLNASYGFNCLPVNKLSSRLPIISEYTIPDSIVVPLPTEYIRELWHVVTESLRPGTLLYENFLMGYFSQKGWFYFYILAFLIKTPLPMLIFFTVAACMLLRKPFKENMAKESFLWIPPLVILVLASLQNCQVGLRHILPIYPFLFVSSGKLVHFFYSPKKYSSLMIAVLSLWLIVSTVKIFPDYLAYFNELAGGPRHGHKWLVDHDWGQDLPGLKKYMSEKGIKKIKLCYLGSPGVWPQYYGIDYEPIPQLPASGIIAISVAYLQGFAMVTEERGKYQWLKEYKPIAKIGYSIFVYDINLPKN